MRYALQQQHLNNTCVHLRLVPHIPIAEIGGLISAVDQGQSPGFEPRSCSAMIEDWPCFLRYLGSELSCFGGVGTTFVRCNCVVMR